MSVLDRWYDEDSTPLNEDEVKAYNTIYWNLHDFKPGPDGTCIEKLHFDKHSPVCGGYGHNTFHNDLPCCYCKHGVYRHTEYDIPCGRCEAEADGYYDD